MTPLHVEAEGTAQAPPGALWALVSDADSYARWGPWDESGYRPADPDVAQASEPLRWFRTGRTTTVERVLEAEEPSRLVYTVVGGIPVRNYRAEVTLAPTGSGTHIRWAATWDRTLAGWLVHRVLSRFYPKMLAQLLSYAETGPPVPDPEG